MRHFTPLLATIALLIAGCQATNTAQTKTVPMPSGLGDDYVVMQRELTFTPEQKAEYQEALKVRNAAYDAWAKSPDGKQYAELRSERTRAQRTGNNERLAQLTPQYDAARARQEKMRADLRRDFNKCLTLDQQKEWAGRNLYIRAMAALNKPSLTTEQAKQARDIANAIAAERVKPDTASKDPYLLLDEAAVNKTTDEIRSQVLKTNKA